MLALNGSFLARYLARNVQRGNDLRQGGGHQGGGLHQVDGWQEVLIVKSNL